MNAHPACYGKMFPDLKEPIRNVRQNGKAFSTLAVSHGIGTQERDLEVKTGEWEACIACPDYRTCYDLCMAKLQLNRELREF